MAFWSFFNRKRSVEDTQKVAESFQSMVSTFVSDAVSQQTRIIIAYRIKGCGDWHVAIADKACRLFSGKAPKCDLTIKTDFDTWMAISNGDTTGEEMYFAGKLKATGDRNVLMQLPHFFISKQDALAQQTNLNVT